MKFLPNRLRELRLMHKHSLTTACRMLEVRCGYRAGRTSFYNWEKGKTLPKINALLAICELYGVEPAHFFDTKAS